MPRLASAAILLVAIVVTVSGQELSNERPAEIDHEHTRWINEVLRSIITIQPGMTRKNVARLLTEDGGLQFRGHGRYVYAKCPYIKVDIEFSAVDGGEKFSPEDKIVKVSRPYLEYPTSD